MTEDSKPYWRNKNLLHSAIASHSIQHGALVGFFMISAAGMLFIPTVVALALAIPIAIFTALAIHAFFVLHDRPVQAPTWLARLKKSFDLKFAEIEKNILATNSMFGQQAVGVKHKLAKAGVVAVAIVAALLNIFVSGYVGLEAVLGLSALLSLSTAATIGIGVTLGALALPIIVLSALCSGYAAFGFFVPIICKRFVNTSSTNGSSSDTQAQPQLDSLGSGPTVLLTYDQNEAIAPILSRRPKHTCVTYSKSARNV